jgi:hypothetical protein
MFYWYQPKNPDGESMVKRRLEGYMSNKKNFGSENEQNKTEEPKTEYKSLRIFESFEEQEEENRWFATLTPEQRLQHATDLIKRVFARQLKKNPKIGKRIYFD